MESEAGPGLHPDSAASQAWRETGGSPSVVAVEGAGEAGAGLGWVGLNHFGALWGAGAVRSCLAPRHGAVRAGASRQACESSPVGLGWVSSRTEGVLVEEEFPVSRRDRALGLALPGQPGLKVSERHKVQKTSKRQRDSAWWTFRVTQPF